MAPFLPFLDLRERPLVGFASKQDGKGGIPMASCNECRQFFPIDEDPDKGDCVRRVVDPRQAYYRAKPVDSDREAGDCPDFQRKPQPQMSRKERR